MQRYVMGVVTLAAGLVLVGRGVPVIAGENCPHEKGAQLESETMHGDTSGAAVVPGSATPGAAMKSDEIEATDKTGTHGGARDATGGYDARGVIQSDEDAEASAGSMRQDFDSLLQQKNLKEAMDPKNGDYKSRKTAAASDDHASNTATDTGSEEMAD